MNTISSLLNWIGNTIGADPDTLSTTDKTLVGAINETISGSKPIGSIQMYAGSTAPAGWLMCDGSAVSRSEYADLFAVIGTTFGYGDGSTTFNVPDMRDRFAVGAGDSYNLNDQGGVNSVTLSTGEIPAHTHGNKSLTGIVACQSYSNATPSGIVSTSYKNINLASPGAGSNMGTHNQKIDASHEHDSVGGGGAHENRPPYIAINYIISAKIA